MATSEPVLASLDPEYLKWAKRQAARGGMSVQAFMRQQMGAKDEHQEQGEVMGAEHGPGKENGGMMGNMKGISELMENLPNLMMMKMIFGGDAGGMFGAGQQQKGLTREDVQEIIEKTLSKVSETKKPETASERMKQMLYEKAELKTLKEMAEGSGETGMSKFFEQQMKMMDDRMRGMQEDSKQTREAMEKQTREAQETVRKKEMEVMQGSVNQLGEVVNNLAERLEHPPAGGNPGEFGDITKVVALKKSLTELENLFGGGKAAPLPGNADVWDKAGKMIQDVAKGVADVMGSTGEVLAAKQGVHPKSLGQMPDAPEDQKDYQPHYSSTPAQPDIRTMDGLRKFLPDNGVYKDENDQVISKESFLQRYGQSYLDHPEAFNQSVKETPPPTPSPAPVAIPRAPPTPPPPPQADPVPIASTIVHGETVTGPVAEPESTTVSDAMDKALAEPAPEAPKPAKAPRARKGKVKLPTGTE